MSLIKTADYSVFASTDFDPNEYANATLAGEPYPPQPQVGASAGGTKAKPGIEPAQEDISVAIAKLNFGVEDVSKQIKNVVSEWPPKIAYLELAVVLSVGNNTPRRTTGTGRRSERSG